MFVMALAGMIDCLRRPCFETRVETKARRWPIAAGVGQGCLQRYAASSSQATPDWPKGRHKHRNRNSARSAAGAGATLSPDHTLSHPRAARTVRQSRRRLAARHPSGNWRARWQPTHSRLSALSAVLSPLCCLRWPPAGPLAVCRRPFANPVLPTATTVAAALGPARIAISRASVRSRYHSLTFPQRRAGGPL